MRTAGAARAAVIVWAAALAIAGGACASRTGLRVDLDFNGMSPDELDVTISASPDGFATPQGSGLAGVTLSTQTDPAGKAALLVKLVAPDFKFGSTYSFRLDTQNDVALSISASAIAFRGATEFAGADAAPQALPAGGDATIKLVLEPRSGMIAPDTRTTDLTRDAADFTVLGDQKNGRLSALATCDMDGDTHADVIIGAPAEADSRGLGPVGAVHIVFGGGAAGATIDLANPPAAAESRFYGEFGGDQLGAAVACADLDGDGLGDLVVGAPGANNGAGRVYVIYGRRTLRQTPPTVAGAGAEWFSGTATAGLGGAVFAGDLDGDGKAEALVSEPGAGKVHLFALVTASATPRDVGASDHVTFSHVNAAALGGGDLDGDSKPDVIIGDPQFRPAGAIPRTGVVYVFAGVDPKATTSYDVGATDASLLPALTIVGAEQAQLGAAVLALDTSGSGQDLLIGAPGAASGTGAVYLYEYDMPDFFVAPTRTPAQARVTLTGSVANGRFGSALGAALSGVNGSGGANLLVGALAVTRGARTQAGAAYMLRGGHDRAFPLVAQVFGAAANDHLGSAVAGGPIGGDDLIGDMVVVAPDATGSGATTSAGVVYVLFGH